MHMHIAIIHDIVTPDVVVELFGSTYTGFALKDSDINMNLRFKDCNNSYVRDIIYTIQ